MKSESGGIAQLGERLNGIQEVSGSIPLISTKEKDTSKDVSFFLWSGLAVEMPLTPLAASRVTPRVEKQATKNLVYLGASC